MKALRFNVTTLRFVLTKAIGAFLGKWVYYNSPLATIKYVDIPEPDLPTEQDEQLYNSQLDYNQQLTRYKAYRHGW